jgi:hypothetical protein
LKNQIPATPSFACRTVWHARNTASSRVLGASVTHLPEAYVPDCASAAPAPLCITAVHAPMDMTRPRLRVSWCHRLCWQAVNQWSWRTCRAKSQPRPPSCHCRYRCSPRLAESQRWQNRPHTTRGILRTPSMIPTTLLANPSWLLMRRGTLLQYKHHDRRSVNIVLARARRG